MRSQYGRLAAIAAAAGLLVAVVGGVLLAADSHTSARGEWGKWALTLSAGLLLTGALSMLLRAVDERRADRDQWQSVLATLVAASQAVAQARLLLAAHKTAKTYHDQFAELMTARLELRRLSTSGPILAESDLVRRIQVMRRYLEALGREYEGHYLGVSRQQRLDEEWLTQRTKAEVEARIDEWKKAPPAHQAFVDGPPPMPAPVAAPTPAWTALQDKETFPRLCALRDDKVFPLDTFRTSYKLAKRRVERLAGIRGDPPGAQLRSALRLTRRTGRCSVPGR